MLQSGLTDPNQLQQTDQERLRGYARDAPWAEQFGRRQRPWPRRRNPMQAPGDDRRLQYGLQR